jgi:hypothetical protein
MDFIKFIKILDMLHFGLYILFAPTYCIRIKYTPLEERCYKQMAFLKMP